MRPLDEQERKIIQALIKNPRETDNSVAKLTGVPVMSVNRKRRRLEQEEIINYYVAMNDVTRASSKQLYIIKLRAGITEKSYIEQVEKDSRQALFALLRPESIAPLEQMHNHPQLPLRKEQRSSIFPLQYLFAANQSLHPAH